MCAMRSLPGFEKSLEPRWPLVLPEASEFLIFRLFVVVKAHSTLFLFFLHALKNDSRLRLSHPPPRTPRSITMQLHQCRRAYKTKYTRKARTCLVSSWAAPGKQKPTSKASKARPWGLKKAVICKVFSISQQPRHVWSHRHFSRAFQIAPLGSSLLLAPSVYGLHDLPALSCKFYCRVPITSQIAPHV